MGRRPSLTNGCLVVHMQSYTRLDTNLTGTKILMKALTAFLRRGQHAEFLMNVCLYATLVAHDHLFLTNA